ncbi:MAG: Brp/Blh family beta-carotene 15,15'-dioxygenase [Salinarimonas sp.]|nr:Brp/Blh family beta-carotene 15,15'-dioxygenase [Salinarimonas sp.]
MDSSRPVEQSQSQAPEHESSLAPGDYHAWFAALKRAHAIAALAVIGVTAIVYPFVAPDSVLFQLAMAAALIMLLVLPHAALDQYAALIVLQPRLGWLWPLGFMVIYGLLAVATVAGWMVYPQFVLPGIIVLAALHYGLGDVETGSWWRYPEILVRGLAPFALAVLFSLPQVTAFAGWLVLDVPMASRVIYDWILPVALAWQGLWALVILRALWLALSERGDAVHAVVLVCEMAVLVLAFAMLPPLIAFALYVGLLHAPRHLLDFAARNPALGNPSRALTRVLRATILPTAMTIALLAVMIFFFIDPTTPHGYSLRIAIWLVTAFSVPHAVFTFLALRGFGGPRVVAPEPADHSTR